MTNEYREIQPDASSIAALIPSDILERIYAWLSPTPPHSYGGYSYKQHAVKLQRVAGVNKQWRAAALPLLYRTAIVIISDYNYNYNKVEDKPWTNIELLHDAGQIDYARDMLICVIGTDHRPTDYVRILWLAGFDDTVWMGIERLRFDTGTDNTSPMSPLHRKKSKALPMLNDLLSQALPSLSEIYFGGYGICEVYECIPIDQLIDERLRGPKPLQVLRIESDCNPEFEGFGRYMNDPPLAIERLILD
ncbi:hypothetical protein H4S07_001949, partial [Coemansia furcata]